MLEAAKLRIQSYARWKNNTIHSLGLIEIAFGLLLLVPAVVALAYGEDPVWFLAPAPVMLVAGSVQCTLFYSDHRMAPSICILMLTFMWFMAFIVMAVPFAMYGLPWYDAFFESVSGFTTTGATIVSGDMYTELPRSIMFWRSFTQWIGGIAIVIIFMLLLPMMGVGGRMFLNNELSGSDTANLSYKMKSVALSFIIVYGVLTIIEIALLLLCGVNMFESACMTLSNISTGGMMTRADSISSYGTAVKAIVLVFMFLGGTNFFLHYRAIYKREFLAYFKNREFVNTLFWFLSISVLVTGLCVYNSGSDDLYAKFSGALFTVVSVGTTTGYSITNFDEIWPVAASFALCAVGLVGAMAGSTSGGMKVYRAMIMRSFVSYTFHKMIHPNSIQDIRLGRDSTVNDDTLMSTLMICILFIGVTFVSAVFFCIAEPAVGENILDAMGLAIATVGNVGMGLGSFGPSGSLTELTVLSKMVMCFLMWIGRLEVFMVLILFTRTFWKDIHINVNVVVTNKNGNSARFIRKRKH